MATDFFQRQFEARRSTKWLVLLFALAVIGIVAVTYFATAYAVEASASSRAERYSDGRVGKSDDLQAAPMAAALAALGIILLGSLYKVSQLRGGGTIVAESLGGRPIQRNTADLVERRVLNVVEEMALASGVPVPPVYLLANEQGINAFAAGYSPSDAVVAITRGTAEQLTRDQLQGVIAHEFSHILNGDMRLNIRLIGILHGILLLGLLGRFLFRIAAHSGRSRSKNNGAMVFVLIGLALLILGFVGSLMGNLIKAAVSRQREYLADASAVQFTRNPEGLAGALKRIGAWVKGSLLGHENAAEASHMYFSKGIRFGLDSLFDTHPPLPKRILALDPRWDGKYPAVPAKAAVLTELGPGAAGLVGGAMSDSVSAVVVEHAAEQVGKPTEIHRAYSAQLVRELPKEVVEAAHEAYGARAVVFALLLDREKSVRESQLKALAKLTTPDIVDLTHKLAPVVDQLDVRARLPLVDIALPALRSMAKSQFQEFSQAFRALVDADDRLALFEWTLHRILLRHLQPQFVPLRPKRIAYYGLQRLGEACSVLLSTLVYAGNPPELAQAAMAEASQHLPEVSISLLPSEACNLAQLDKALLQLERVAAKHRGRLIEACAAAICADRVVKIREAELLRGISDMLDCPMPPLLPGQEVA